MGMTSNIIVLMFILSFAIYLGTPDHNGTLFLDLVTGGENLKGQMVLLFSLAGVSAIASGLFGVSPSYALFTAIGTFLLGFFTLPTSVFMSADLPIEIKLLMAGIFGIMFVMSLLSWFKGVGDL